jgi:hypothetical protein
VNEENTHMGYIAHHAIIVTSWDKTILRKAHERATTFDCHVSDIVESGVNGYHSFLIAPDGSKEGWDESRRGDAQRAAWIEWSRSVRYEDGSSPLSWVEVRYGSDDHDAKVERHEWLEVHSEGAQS